MCKKGCSSSTQFPTQLILPCVGITYSLFRCNVTNVDLPVYRRVPCMDVMKTRAMIIKALRRLLRLRPRREESDGALFDVVQPRGQ